MKIREISGSKKSKTKYVSYAETHPKSFISALIIQGMANDPSVDIKKIESLYASLDESLKATKPAKAIELKIKEIKSPSVGTVPQPGAGDAHWSSDFSAPNPQGKITSLKENLGKVVWSNLSKTIKKFKTFVNYNKTGSKLILKQIFANR